MPLQLLSAEELEAYRAAERDEQEATRAPGERDARAEHLDGGEDSSPSREVNQSGGIRS